MASERLYCMECVEGRPVALGLCADCLAGEPLEEVIRQISRLTRELEAARELLRQIAADRCRCLHPFDICGNCRARRALVADTGVSDGE